MGHQSGKGAERAVKNSQRTTVAETRTSEEIIKDIRGNLNSPLAILKTDVAVLLDAYSRRMDLIADMVKEDVRLNSVIADADARLLAAAQVIEGLQGQIASMNKYGVALNAEEQVEAERVHALLRDTGGEE